MSNWGISELIECMRYGLLVVYIKDDQRGYQVCRRVRRKKEKLFCMEMFYMHLPKQYGQLTLEQGDLVFIARDNRCDVLRSVAGVRFADIKDTRIKMNPSFFNEVKNEL